MLLQPRQRRFQEVLSDLNRVRPAFEAGPECAITILTQALAEERIMRTGYGGVDLIGRPGSKG